MEFVLSIDSWPWKEIASTQPDMTPNVGLRVAQMDLKWK